MKLIRMSVWDRLANNLHTKLYRFQVRGVRFIERHKGRILLGDDMGLGKTIQSIGWMAIRPEIRPVVIVCPASVKYGWQAELKQHAGLDSYVCSGELPSNTEINRSIKKSLARLNKKKWTGTARRTAAQIKFKALGLVAKRADTRTKEVDRKRVVATRQEILIINYDILKGWLPVLLALRPQLLIIDECQKISNRTTQQTKACLKLGKKCPYILALSGTPFTSKPVQLYPVLHLLRPREFPSFWKYAFQYCGPTKNPWGHGWDYGGATNLNELHHRIKKIMIRRMKVDVLQSLPPKVRTVIPVSISNRADYNNAKDEFVAWLRNSGGERAVKRAMGAIALVRLGKLKLLAAEGKMKMVTQWIKDFLVSTDEKLIVFGIHKIILRGMFKQFEKQGVIVDGSVPTSKRDALVQQFQNNKKCRVFFGQMKACGIGMNGLVVASTVLFLELGWTPAEHDQAEDRALRIGQKADSVNVFYIVGRNTVEERVMEVIDKKRGICKEVLDGTSVFPSILKRFI